MKSHKNRIAVKKGIWNGRPDRRKMCISHWGKNYLR